MLEDGLRQITPCVALRACCLLLTQDQGVNELLTLTFTPGTGALQPVKFKQKKPQILIGNEGSRLHLPRFFMPLRSCVDVGAVYLDLSTVLGPSRAGVYSLRLGSLFMPREGPPPTPDCPCRRKEEGLRGEKFQGEEFPQPLKTI